MRFKKDHKIAFIASTVHKGQ